MSHEIMGVKDLFYFFGQLMGKAMFDHIPVCISLNHSILYALLDKEQIDLEQFSSVDEDVYRSLKFFRDSDLTEHGDYLD